MDTTRKIKICLGLLSNRGFKGKTVLSLLKMIAASDFDFHFAFIDSGYTIAENRNYLAIQALKNDCDYLLMVDDDMIFPPESLNLLVSRNKDIIGLPYNVKATKKAQNVTYFPTDDKPLGEAPVGATEPMEVMAIGGGVILIKCDVFRKLSQPFFDFESYENGMTKIGEDSFFCYKAQENGYKIYCEPTLEGLGHIGDFIY